MLYPREAYLNTFIVITTNESFFLQIHANN
jgi:hypothetical protein